VEIKCGPEVLPVLEDTFSKAHTRPKQIVIITFNYDVAKEAKERFPRTPVFWLSSWAKDKKTGEYPNLDDLIKKAKDAHLDGLDLDYHFPLDRAAVKRIKSADLECHVWTVDDAAKARELAEAGVDGITTNRPGWLRDQLKK
jgi:glycerophosphoryl diester phosphodiesterase